MKRLFFALFALFLMSAPMRVCGELTWTWNSTTKTMTISGSGAMKNYTNAIGNQSPAYNRDDIKAVIIEEGVTTIGAYAFFDCSALSSVKVPSTLTQIGKNAFRYCEQMAKIYAPSPNMWASITFDITETSYSVPFSESTATSREFFFNGKNTATTMLVFTPGITEIKPYAFYNATGIKGVNLPNSVQTIGAHAFDCSIGTNVAINRATPPTTGDKAFSFDTGTETYLYLPEGASNTYLKQPWYYNKGTQGTGAYKVGYKSDAVVSLQKITVNGEDRNLYLTSGKCGENITWTLQNDGTLVLEGSGDMPVYSSSNNATTCLPWWRFRYLVHKAVIRGASSEQQITDIKNALKWCYALTSITIEQSTIPEIDIDLNATEFLSEVVEISVPLTDLNAEALTQEPWSNMNIHLSEPLVIDENQALNTWNGYKNLSGDAIEEVNIIRALSNSYYNTFCSPVSGEVATLLGADAEVYEFASVSGDVETGYTFTFSPLNGDIVAGTPYLVKPGSNIAQIELTNVATSQLTTEAQTVTQNEFSFCGVLAPTDLSGEDKYVLGDGDLLYKALPGQMKGMRAYFTFPANPSGVAPRVALSFTNTPTDNAAPVADLEVKKYLYKNQMFIRGDKQTYLLQGIEKQ